MRALAMPQLDMATWKCLNTHMRMGSHGTKRTIKALGGKQLWQVNWKCLNTYIRRVARGMTGGLANTQL